MNHLRSTAATPGLTIAQATVVSPPRHDPERTEIRRLIEHACDEPVQSGDPGAIEYASWLPPLRPAAS
jgi:hypothetical protein